MSYQANTELSSSSSSSSEKINLRSPQISFFFSFLQSQLRLSPRSIEIRFDSCLTKQQITKSQSEKIFKFSNFFSSLILKLSFLFPAEITDVDTGCCVSPEESQGSSSPPLESPAFFLQSNSLNIKTAGIKYQRPLIVGGGDVTATDGANVVQQSEAAVVTSASQR